MTTYLTRTEASAWFEAALAVLSAPNDVDRWGWVLAAKRQIRSKPSWRKRCIADLFDAADNNRRFRFFEAQRDARILCFCATVLRALEVKR